MKKNILISFFLFFIFIFIGVFSSLVWYAKDTPAASLSFNDEVVKDNLEENISLGWIGKMANIKKSDFALPVNIFLMDIDFEKIPDIPKKKVFEIVLGENDKYSLFCIKQTLQDLLLPYAINNETNIIYIKSNEKNKIDELARQLKKYNIQTDIKEAWL